MERPRSMFSSQLALVAPVLATLFSIELAYSNRGEAYGVVCTLSHRCPLSRRVGGTIPRTQVVCDRCALKTRSNSALTFLGLMLGSTVKFGRAVVGLVDQLD